MKNLKSDRKLYNSKKTFLMVAAILIGSMFAGYQAHNMLDDSVKAGLCVGMISFVAGMSIVLWVAYYGNKEDKD